MAIGGHPGHDPPAPLISDRRWTDPFLNGCGRKSGHVSQRCGGEGVQLREVLRIEAVLSSCLGLRLFQPPHDALAQHRLRDSPVVVKLGWRN